MLQQGIRQAQVAFGVFKVNRVHFMRHGGRTNFARDGFLLEVVQRHIAPHVTIKIDQDGVETGDAVKQLSNIVVRLDLRGVRVPLDAQRSHELFAELVPVNFRIGGDVRIVVADRTVDFAQDFNLFQLAELALHTVRHVRHLFTHG
ncbi:hypothetical protein D3C80_1344840 [compost metagenome]